MNVPWDEAWIAFHIIYSVENLFKIIGLNWLNIMLLQDIVTFLNLIRNTYWRNTSTTFNSSERVSLNSVLLTCLRLYLFIEKRFRYLHKQKKKKGKENLNVPY